MKECAGLTRHGQRLSCKTFPDILDILARNELVQRKEFPGFITHSRKCFPVGKQECDSLPGPKATQLCLSLEIDGGVGGTQHDTQRFKK